ncbi:hydroxycarboxylic acid receptor 2-like [Protopterus annectens]|uniref:hydroxycarboxylic acid receptor 2-like n=1 Tax=Protopterus annectens TaxID=7888 RepID=UPI001CFB5763|nr:hydroxycarboxylic acid receptor 2-like [Protopterus annectens]
MNSTSCCVFHEPLLIKYLPPVLIVEFIFGVAGNGIGLWMFCFQMKTWRPNNVYLLNLALADTLVLLCIAFRTDYYLRGQNWIHGDISCRLLLYMLAVNRAAGIFFLTVVAIDRYFKIVHPLFRISRITLKESVVVSFALWLLVTSMTSYILAQSRLFFNNNQTQCESFNICPSVLGTADWHEAFYISQFLIPTCIISYCTIRISWQLKNKTVDKHGKIKKAVQFVTIVAVVFAVCFFPSNLVRITVQFLKLKYGKECEQFKQANLAFYTSVCLTYFNSALNPVVYYFSSPSFQGLFRKILNKISQRADGTNNLPPQSISFSNTN